MRATLKVIPGRYRENALHPARPKAAPAILLTVAPEPTALPTRLRVGQNRPSHRPRLSSRLLGVPPRRPRTRWGDTAGNVLGYHEHLMATYHLRRTEQAITDPEDLQAVLLGQRYMTVAMCRDGEPYVVTLNHGYSAEENALYFHCAPAGLKLDFLRENPTVCATAVEDLGYRTGECAHAYRSVVVRGQLRVVADREGKARGLRVLLAHHEGDPRNVESRLLPDDAAYSRVTVLRLEIDEITGKRSA